MDCKGVLLITFFVFAKPAYSHEKDFEMSMIKEDIKTLKSVVFKLCKNNGDVDPYLCGKVSTEMSPSMEIPVQRLTSGIQAKSNMESYPTGATVNFYLKDHYHARSTDTTSYPETSQMIPNERVQRRTSDVQQSTDQVHVILQTNLRALEKKIKSVHKKLRKVGKECRENRTQREQSPKGVVMDYMINIKLKKITDDLKTQTQVTERLFSRVEGISDLFHNNPLRDNTTVANNENSRADTRRQIPKTVLSHLNVTIRRKNSDKLLNLSTKVDAVNVKIQKNSQEINGLVQVATNLITVQNNFSSILQNMRSQSAVHNNLSKVIQDFQVTVQRNITNFMQNLQSKIDQNEKGIMYITTALKLVTTNVLNIDKNITRELHYLQSQVNSHTEKLKMINTTIVQDGFAIEQLQNTSSGIEAQATKDSTSLKFIEDSFIKFHNEFKNDQNNVHNFLQQNYNDLHVLQRNISEQSNFFSLVEQHLLQGLSTLEHNLNTSNNLHSSKFKSLYSELNASRHDIIDMTRSVASNTQDIHRLYSDIRLINASTVSDINLLSIKCSSLTRTMQQIKTETHGNQQRIQTLSSKHRAVAFHATLASSKTNIVFPGEYIVKYKINPHFTNGGYQSQTGLFTCPTTGKYVFFFQVQGIQTTKAQLHLIVNKSRSTEERHLLNKGSDVIMIYLTTGDLVGVYYKVPYFGFTQTLNENSFSGFLL